MKYSADPPSPIYKCSSISRFKIIKQEKSYSRTISITQPNYSTNQNTYLHTDFNKTKLKQFKGFLTGSEIKIENKIMYCKIIQYKS